MTLMFMLLISNLTVSYAQTGDTLTCYTNEELRKIANVMVQAKECDTLYNITLQQLELKDSVISNQSHVINAKDSIITQQDDKLLIKDVIIDGYMDEYYKATELLDKEKRKHKWTKAGWVATTLGLIALMITR